MNRNELKFRANKIAETGLSGSVLELLIIGLAEEYAMEQNLQQTPCTAPLELLKKMLNDEYTAYNNNIDNYMKSSEHDYNVETIRNVIKLIEERQPMT